jgi:hypothetical protein
MEVRHGLSESKMNRDSSQLKLNLREELQVTLY